MALQVHGMLETTGLPSVSARLQHASLPMFDNSSSRRTSWVEEGNDDQGQALDARRSSSLGSDPDDPTNFEHGVIHVDSELESEAGEFGSVPTADQDGYDLLPLPVPAPERRILSVGSPERRHRAPEHDGNDPFAGLLVEETSHTRFRYGSSTVIEQFPPSDSGHVQSAFLGEFAVDSNIDKLREVIGSVENTLKRCLSASAGIGGARRDRLALHLEVVKGFDSWQGMRGQFITQRALLRGVEGLDQSKDVSEECDLDIIDGKRSFVLLLYMALLRNLPVSSFGFRCFMADCSCCFGSLSRRGCTIHSARSSHGSRCQGCCRLGRGYGPERV